jgi:hypothetical protein
MIHTGLCCQSRGGAIVKQLSVRGIDDELERRIREIARREGISLNRAALLLLRKGAGVGAPGKQTSVVGDSLDHLIGSWSKEETRELLRSIQPLEQIDRSFRK